VLILPPGHAQAVSTPRRLTGGERRSVGIVGAVVVVLVALALFSLTSGTAKLARGCINVTVQSSLGGQVMAGCGATARAMCASVGAPGGYVGELAAVVGAQCRKQGIKVR
jgi:hypothetical protein